MDLTVKCIDMARCRRKRPNTWSPPCHILLVYVSIQSDRNRPPAVRLHQVTSPAVTLSCNSTSIGYLSSSWYLTAAAHVLCICTYELELHTVMLFGVA